MGEEINDEPEQLRTLLATAPSDAGPRVPAVQILIAEIEAAARAAFGRFERGEVRAAPYAKARVAGGALDLFHGERGAWIPAADRDALRAGPPEPPPDARALRALWKGIDASQPDIEHRFEAATARHRIHVAHDLMVAGDHAAVETIAAAALAQGPRFRGHWWNLLGESRLRRGDLEGASTAIAYALLFCQKWAPRALALMYRWYEASAADEETLGVVYHGAGAWALEVKGKDYLGRRRLPKPPKLKTRFAELFARWVRPAWPGADKFNAAELRDLRSIFEDLGGRVLADLRRAVQAKLDALDRPSP